MLTETSGGLMTVLALPQIVYLDFDGELTSYNGEILTIDEVAVEDSKLTKERIVAITKALNEQFAAQNVRFVSTKSDLSDQSDYSTVYIGKTTAFAPYGSFAGVAETVDSGNKNKSDKAFVMLDSTVDDAQIIETIAHETSHLLGTLDHGGDGLQKYASSYIVSSGVTSTGITLNYYDSMYVSSGGTANSTIVNSGGDLYVSRGGTANNTTVNSCGNLWVFNGGTANSTTVNSGGDLDVWSGGTANCTTVNSRGNLRVYSGGMTNSTSVNSGGNLDVWSGGTANSTTVNSRGNLRVYSGGMTNSTSVNSSGYLLVSSGGTANNVIWTPCIGEIRSDFGAAVTYASTYSGVYYGRNNALLSSAMSMSGKIVSGSMYVMSGGTANSITVNSGNLHVWSCGLANNTAVNSWGRMFVSSCGIANSTTVNSGWLRVSNGGTANNTIVNLGGNLHVWSGGTANSNIVNSGGWLVVYSGGTVNNTSVNSGGRLVVYSSGTANSTTVNNGDWMDVYSGGTANKTTVNSGGNLDVWIGGTHCGSLQIALGAKVSAYQGAIIDFTVAEQMAPETALINNWSLISGGSDASYSITVNANQAEGEYMLAGGAAGFSNVITVKNTNSTTLGTLSVGGELVVKNTNYSLALNGSTLKLTVSGKVPTALVGNSNGISWSGSAESYAAEYSTDDFAHGLRIATSQTAVDTYGMDGSYDWRVCNNDSEKWAQGEEITAVHEAPQELVSDADGIGDLFFSTASGTWGSRYNAQHLGVDSWGGTKELVALAGKNQITDVFAGSTDANILVLTDDGNGDALFLDDIYSAFPTEQKARLAQIDEIRAGVGDDIIDLTSQRFDYTNGMILRGGKGDDTIWANKGENMLFGDSGNDRLVGCFNDDVIVGGSGNDSMNGGSGNDIFCFCDNYWGTDTVEQLANGTVTLWFESQTGTWDQATMTYSDGTNSVKVSGVSSVTLKYGDDGSAQYDELVAAGAFLEKSSSRIFEKENTGVIAQI